MRASGGEGAGRTLRAGDLYVCKFEAADEKTKTSVFCASTQVGMSHASMCKLIHAYACVYIYIYICAYVEQSIIVA